MPRYRIEAELPGQPATREAPMIMLNLGYNINNFRQARRRERSDAASGPGGGENGVD